MPVNRDLYKPKIFDEQVPSWVCGRCGVGTLTLMKDSFVEQEGQSRLYHKEDYFEPFMIASRFICFAVCTNGPCSDVSVVAGDGEVLENYDRNGRTIYEDQYTIKFVSPAPRLFVYSPDLPKSICTELDKAFGLFWTDLNACLNALRSALEVALDECKVPRFRLSKPNRAGKQKRSKLVLHDRIGLIRQKDSDARTLLEAAKWITNTGSHGSVVEIGVVYDAMDLTEHALNILFDKSSDRLRKLAIQVSKKKGRV